MGVNLFTKILCGIVVAGFLAFFLAAGIARAADAPDDIPVPGVGSCDTLERAAVAPQTAGFELDRAGQSWNWFSAIGEPDGAIVAVWQSPAGFWVVTETYGPDKTTCIRFRGKGFKVHKSKGV